MNPQQLMNMMMQMQRGPRDPNAPDPNPLFYRNEIPSKPDGDLVDAIHANWDGNFDLLEEHHSYIQVG